MSRTNPHKAITVGIIFGLLIYALMMRKLAIPTEQQLVKLDNYQCGPYPQSIKPDAHKQIKQWLNENILPTGDPATFICSLPHNRYVIQVDLAEILSGLYLIDLNTPDNKLSGKLAGGFTRLVAVMSDKKGHPYWLTTWHTGGFGIHGYNSSTLNLVNPYRIAWYLNSQDLTFTDRRELHESMYQNGAGNGGCEFPGRRAKDQQLIEILYSDLKIQDYNQDGFRDIVLLLQDKDCRSGKVRTYFKIFLAQDSGFSESQLVPLPNDYLKPDHPYTVLFRRQ